MRLAIVGSRDFNDYDLMEDYIRKLYRVEDIELIVSGGARGADSLGARFAESHDIPLLECLPNWDKHGARAGFIRNHEIVRNADKLIAFWDGVSPGTKHSIGVGKRALKSRNVFVVHYNEREEMF